LRPRQKIKAVVQQTCVFEKFLEKYELGKF